MKKCIIVIIAVLCSFLGVKMLFAVPDTWTQKTDFGGTARSNAVGFSIGGKGCIGTDWRDPIEKDFWEYEPTPMTLTVASSNPDSGVSITVNPTAVELTTTQIIPLHYEIMRNTPFEPGEETGGSVFMVILPSMVGSREIALDDASEMKSKLFVYRGTDGKYHTNVVERIDHNTIICRHPLEADIDIGKTVFHFYANLNHPGEEGYYAIADQALSHLAGNLNNRIHVLLGDSWFNAPYIRTRLLESLPEASIIGAGGSGNRAAQLLARFDADVTPTSLIMFG